MEAHKLLRRLNSTRIALRKWNKTSFGFAQEEIKKVEADLLLLQFGGPSQQARVIDIEVQLREHRRWLEVLLHQKARELWIDAGDRNTKYFHTSVLMRRRANRINAIEDNGRWLKTCEDVGNYFIREFQELFSTSSPKIPWLGDFGGCDISDAENSQIHSIPDLEEIKNVTWDLHPLKSPGMDGFPRSFFRTYWNTIQDQLVYFVQECFRTKGMSRGVNKTFIVLLPKCQSAKNMNHFWPISLCNFSYKVVSKILVNRLKHLLSRIISPNQEAFIRGRWIVKNTVVTQELVT